MSVATEPPLCGSMDNKQESSIYLTRTCLDLKDAYYLCEFPSSTPTFNTNYTTTDSGIRLTGMQDDPVFNISAVQCRNMHWTQDFLACDVHSNCWSRDDVPLQYSSNDGLAVTSAGCDVPGALSNDLSFLCSTRSERVPFTLVCDFQPDCFDRSDEDFCTHPQCYMDNPLQCGNTGQVRV